MKIAVIFTWEPQGTQPNSQAWVDGYPHEAWLRLNSFFARAFKDGTYPQIIRDVIYVWARPHPKDAIANEEVPRPDNWQLVRSRALFSNVRLHQGSNRLMT